MRDLQHRLTTGLSIGPATVTTTTNGVGVDSLGFESITLLAQVAAIGGTSPTYTPKIQVSADNVTFYDLDAAGYVGGAAPGAITANGTSLYGIAQLVSAAANAAGVANTSLRYVRAVMTVGGTTPTAGLAVAVVLGYPRHSGVAV